MPDPRSTDFAQLVEVETPEQVSFAYSVAGVGTRAAAALIDYLICLAPGMLLAYLVVPLLRVDRDGQPQSEVGTWIYAIIILANFALLWGYYVFCEGYFDGQTLGKPLGWRRSTRWRSAQGVPSRSSTVAPIAAYRQLRINRISFSSNCPDDGT